MLYIYMFLLHMWVFLKMGIPKWLLRRHLRGCGSVVWLAVVGLWLGRPVRAGEIYQGRCNRCGTGKLVLQ